MIKDSSKSKKASLPQIVFTLLLPLIVLMWFSGESQLGPKWGLITALAFPVFYESASMYRHRKFSYLSLVSFGGILVTGGISLLGLSENWLALRRSAPYAAVGLALFAALLFKKSPVSYVLPYIIDTDKINRKLRTEKSKTAMNKATTSAGYQLSGLLMLLAVSSYILTKIVIKSATDTSQFNQEYARLRILSLPANTLPLLIGITLILLIFVNKLERITGLKYDEILKK